MRLGERSENLRCPEQGRFDFKRSAFQQCGYRLALHEFHDQVVRPDIVKRADVGVIERRYCARFALKSLTELLACDFDCDSAAQSCVYGMEDLAHTAFAEFAFNAVWSEKSSGC